LNNHAKKGFITLLLLGATSASMAEQKSWISSGLTWTQDLAVQTTLMQPLTDTTRQSRSGFETTAGTGWSSLDYKGGYTIGLQGRYDKGFGNNTDISDLALSANTMHSISARWLTKLTAYGILYRNQAFRSSGYDALGTEVTLGYFGSNISGLDLSLGWIREDHNQDSSNYYQTNRIYTEAIWYLPHKRNALNWNISTRLQSSNADNPRFDYSSLQLKAGFNRWKIGKFVTGISVQWQRDDYDHAATTKTPSFNNQPQQGERNRMGDNNMSGMAPPGSQSPTKRHDTLWFLNLKISRAISRNWQLSLSADTGRYQSEPRSSDRQFHDIAIISKWLID